MSSGITLFLHTVTKWLAFPMLSTECRQFIGHGIATFMYEHALSLVIDFQALTAPAVKDGVATELLYHHEMAQARDFTQGVSLFAVAWHGLSDEQAVRVAIIDGEGYTVVDMMELLLTHGTPTFLCNSANKKSADRTTTICARNCSEECLSAQVKMEDGLQVYPLP